jgi:hypothetical protein
MFFFFQSFIKRPAIGKRGVMHFAIRILFSRAIFIIVFASSFFSFNACKKSPTESDEGGSRNYTWIVDTLHFPGTFITSMWGSSTTNVWAVGSGEFDKNVIHFNGYYWDTDQNRHYILPLSIVGADSSDIWMCGSDGLIFHYDGIRWQKYIKVIYPEFNNVILAGMWLENKNSIYLAGDLRDSLNNSRALFMHYDGVKWNEVTIPLLNCKFIKVLKDEFYPESFFFLGWEFDEKNRIHWYIYELKSNLFKLLYEGSDDFSELANIVLIEGRILFIQGQKGFWYENDIFVKCYEYGAGAENGASGRNGNDIIITLKDGLAHYNGSNFKRILTFNSNISIGAIQMFPTSIFCIGIDNTGKSIAFRGYLND